MLQSKRRIKKPNNPATAIGVGLICCGLWLGAGVTAAADPGPLRPSGPAPTVAATAKAKTAKTPEQAKDAKTPLAHFRTVQPARRIRSVPSSSGMRSPARRRSSPSPFLYRRSSAPESNSSDSSGVAGSVEKRVAVVEDAAGKFYTVKLGTVIGQSGGRVADIQEDRVIIEQRSVDQKKQTKVNRVVIQLRKEDYEGRL